MSVSIFTPKAFSMRSAMSPDRSALPLRRLDRAGRETRSAAAAAVTDKPAGWMISVRMKSPGWGGFFMGMAFARRTTASDPYGKSPYPYLISCSLSLNTCQSKNVRSLKQALARGGPTADDISGERLPNYVRGFSTPHSCRQMRSFIAESLSQAAKTGPSSSLNTPKHLQPPEQVSVPAVPRTTECGCLGVFREELGPV